MVFTQHVKTCHVNTVNVICWQFKYVLNQELLEKQPIIFEFSTEFRFEFSTEFKTVMSIAKHRFRLFARLD